MHLFLVAIHFINEDLKLVNLLTSKEIIEAHSGKNITSWLEALLEDYEMSPY